MQIHTLVTPTGPGLKHGAEGGPLFSIISMTYESLKSLKSTKKRPLRTNFVQNAFHLPHYPRRCIHNRIVPYCRHSCLIGSFGCAIVHAPSLPLTSVCASTFSCACAWFRRGEIWVPPVHSRTGDKSSSRSQPNSRTAA